MNRIAFMALIVLAAGIPTGCVNRQAQEQGKQTKALAEDKTAPVKVAVSESGTFVEVLDITGALTSSDDTQVTANSAGRLLAIYVKDGDAVQAGQIVAKQESQEASSRLGQALAQERAARAALRQQMNDLSVSPERSAAAVRAARAQLAQTEAALLKLRNGSRSEERVQAETAVKLAKSNLEVAKADFERAKALFADGAISEREYDQRRLGYESALAEYERATQNLRIVSNVARQEDLMQAEAAVRAARENLQAALATQKLDVQFIDRVDSARANLASAEEAVALARKDLDDTKIRAPFSGRVAGKPVQAGQYLGPGTPILRLVGLGGLYFEGDVPETAVSRLRVGMNVSVAVAAAGNQAIAGKVAAISPSADKLGRIFRVRIALDTVSNELKEGMFAAGKIEIGRLEDQVIIPTAAMTRDGEKRFVFVVNSNKATKKMVTVVAERDGRSAIKGLALGERYIIEGQGQLVDGTVVRIEGKK